jgi:hypothetical protein
LVCQDWPGPDDWKGDISQEHYFSAADIRSTTDLHGLIAFLFASFGGGSEPARSSGYPRVTLLPQRLLSDSHGSALAVVSPIGRLWSPYFSLAEDGEPKILESVIRSLVNGLPIGWAMEFINQRHAELSVMLSTLLMDRHTQSPSSKAEDLKMLERAWQANNDARSLGVFGDPAVRLTTSAR